MEEDKKREHLLCLCCHELMVSPTTLTCGHSYCRLCLALWFQRSGKAECMMCKRKFDEIPAVSYTIRSLTENSFKDEYRERCEQLETRENTLQIRQFEENLRGQKTGVGQPRQKEKWVHYITAGLVLTVIYLIYLLISSIFQSEPLTAKPVSTWSNKEVVQWLSELGTWTEPVIKRFTDLSIDGYLLVTLAKSPGELEPLLRDLDPLYQKAFNLALESTVEINIKPPHDFWEYKNLHLYTVVAMTTIAPSSPRLFIFLTYFFSYNGVFLPLIHRVCPVLENIDLISIYSYQFPAPSFSQWLDFVWKALFFPYLTVFWQFTCYTLYYTNYWIFHYLTVILWLSTYHDIMQVYRCIKDPKTITQYFVQQLVHWKGAVTILFPLYIFWPVVPAFVINIYLFFICVYRPGRKLLQVIREVQRR